jgi:beta-lactamase regulating signal transducer with metallopeptidase domain
MSVGAFSFVGAITLASSLCLGLAATAAMYAALRVWPLRSAAAVRCTLWLTLLLTLIVAPMAFGLNSIRPAQQIRSEVPHVRYDVARTRMPSEAVTAVDPPVMELPARRVPALSTRPNGLGIAGVFCLVWAAGFMFSLGRLVLGLLRLRRAVKASVLLDRRILAGRGTVRVVVSNAFAVPVAVGYVCPLVMVPQSLVRAGGADLENVLLHEFEHLRRFDDVIALLSAAIVCVLWFNPFAHYAFRSIAHEREMACDEAVVSRTGKRAAYAATLWRLANAPAPQAGVLPSFGSGVVSRVLNLLGESTRQSKGALVGVVFATAVTMVSVVALALSAPANVIAPSPVADATSVALAGGGTLVIGGRTQRGGAIAMAQLYDASGRRTSLVAMPAGVWSVAATVLQDGNVLVTGGMTPGGATAAAEVYDTRRSAFESIAPMHFARAAHTSTLLPDGRVLVSSGMGRRDDLVQQTELYDPVRRRFNVAVDGTARVFQTAILIDSGDVLMFGGNNAEGASHCAIIYGTRRGAFKDAGHLLRTGKTSLTFELPNHRIVTHYIRS